MKITHPHLAGFVTFIDFGGAGGGTERGVGGLGRVVSAFIAAGVAHRFIGIADNDAAARSGLAKLKDARVPDRCRIVHYPHLPFLESYPALGTDSDKPVFKDVNGRAGSLEMYFGRDVLTGDDGCLMPVRWSGWDPKLQCYQGSLSDHDKKVAQRRFEVKITAAQEGRSTGKEDWEGVRAIIDCIVAAYD